MNWPKVRLGDVCEFRRGLTYSKGDEVEVSSNVVLRSNNVDLDTGLMVYDELKYISNDFEIPDDKRVVADSVLMCMANGSKAHLGKVGYIEKDLGYAFGGFMGLLVPKGVDGKYLYWVLSSASFKKLIQGLTAGANINNLRFAAIKDFEIPLPPLAEQKKVVEKVEKALERVDALKAQFERMEKSAADYFKAALAETFAAVKGEKVKLGDVCETISVGIVIRPTRYYTANGIKAFRNTNIRACEIRDEDWVQVTDAAIKENPRCEVKMGDVVIARSGLPGVAAAITSAYDGFAAVDILIAKPIANRADSHYLAYAINTSGAQQQIKKMNNGVAQAHIGVNSVSSLLLTLPKMDSQKAIVAALDAARAKSERMAAVARRSIGICGKMRKAVLAEAFQ